MPVLHTAYGHLAGNEPSDLPNLHLSLIDGLVQAEQLERWISLGIPVADRYQLLYETFRPGGPPKFIGNASQAGENVLIASGGGDRGFVLTPDGLAMGLLSQLAGQMPLHSRLVGDPPIVLQNGSSAPTLSVFAARSVTRGTVELVVVNQSLSNAVATQVRMPGVAHATDAQVSTMDGPTATSYNDLEQKNVVQTTVGKKEIGGGAFVDRFPAHSVTLIVLKRVRATTR